jgi:hypothetical protein
VHSEHRVRARETVVSTLQDRLQAEVRRSQQSRDRDRTIFRKVHGREARSGEFSPDFGRLLFLILPTRLMIVFLYLLLLGSQRFED